MRVATGVSSVLSTFMNYDRLDIRRAEIAEITVDSARSAVRSPTS